MESLHSASHEASCDLYQNEQMDEPFDPLDCLVPLPDAEVVVESLGPLLEGPIPPFDVVPDAERQGHPVHVQPLEGACVPWGVVDYEQRFLLHDFLLHDSRASFTVSMVDDAHRPVGFGDTISLLVRYAEK